MQFYALSGSPFSWKVWLALEHLGFDYDLRMLSVDAGDLKSNALLSRNPHGKVPVIEDDGFVLYESSAIIEYLAEKPNGSKKRLWPTDHRQRAIARQKCAEADSYVYPHIRRIVVELLSGKLSPDQDAVTAAKAALTAELPRILGEPKDAFLVAATPTAADFALFPLAAILRRVVKRKPDAGLDEVLALIEPNWFQRMDMLPIVSQTWPPHWAAAPSSTLK